MSYGWHNVRAGVQNVPVPVWYNRKLHHYIAIRGNDDAGVYFVERSIPVPTTDEGLGYVTGYKISPFFVNLHRRPVGEQARQKRYEATSSGDWEPGNYQSALDYVLRYQRKNPGV